jgi:hypothetical protein
MTTELQKLTAGNFSFYTQGSNIELDLTKLNATSKKSHYYALLVAHDHNGKITTIEKSFKEGKVIQFTEASHPIFCLITSKEDLEITRTYFDKQVEKLATETESINLKKAGDLEFYFSTHEKVISAIESNIKLHYSEASNRGVALGLLVIDNSKPYQPNIRTFYEFSELEKLIQQRTALKTMKEDIKGFIEYLTDFPENAFIREDLPDKIDKTINLITDTIEGKQNFSLKVKTTINKSLEKIKTIYSQKGSILDKNKQILSERMSFIDQAINELNRIKTELLEKKSILADEASLIIDKSIQEISTCIENLTGKKENIKWLTAAEYQALIAEYESFFEEQSEKLNSYSQEVEIAIKERKAQLSQEKHTFITETKLKTFTEGLVDEILLNFEKNTLYQEYSELVKKIDSTLRQDCIFSKEIEAIKKETTQLLPKIAQLKETIQHKNKRLINSRLEEIEKISQEIEKIKNELNLFSNELVESVAAEFSQDAIHTQLRDLKAQVIALKTDCSMILKREKLTETKREFEDFQIILQTTKTRAKEKSTTILKEKFLKLQQETTKLKDKAFLTLISQAEKQATLTRSQIKAIENQLILLKKSKINEIKKEITKLENEIENTAAKLHHFTNESFNKGNLKGQLSKITNKLDSLLEADSQLINYPFDSISVEFETFKRDYISKKESSEQNSKDLIKTKLTTIQTKLITQQPKNDKLFGKVASLLSMEEKLIESELKPILIEFYSLKFQNAIASIENHTQKLEGKTAISLREKLLNYLFKPTTQEKLAIEQAINDSLKQIKGSIETAFSSNDIKPLTEKLNELEEKLESPALNEHRSVLFFKFNPTTSKKLAGETKALLTELKTEFTI